jgi:hypothetical protein
MDYKKKYLKYKKKYLDLKGGLRSMPVNEMDPESGVNMGYCIFTKFFNIDIDNIVEYTDGYIPDNANNRIELLFESGFNTNFTVNNMGLKLNYLRNFLNEINTVFVIDFQNLSYRLSHSSDANVRAFETMDYIIKHFEKSNYKNFYIICNKFNHRINLNFIFDQIFSNNYNLYEYEYYSLFKNNIVIIDCDGHSKSHDDYLQWTISLLVSQFITQNNEKSIMKNKSVNNITYPHESPSLMIITNDKQKLYDVTENGIKNLYTELKDKPIYNLRINGQDNYYVKNCLNQLQETFTNFYKKKPFDEVHDEQYGLTDLYIDENQNLYYFNPLFSDDPGNFQEDIFGEKNFDIIFGNKNLKTTNIKDLEINKKSLSIILKSINSMFNNEEVYLHISSFKIYSALIYYLKNIYFRRQKSMNDATIENIFLY